jgi:biopolymer transport protein ExbD
MQFRPRKHRSPPAVIIVALIDILVVLVIFLIVTTTFKQRPTLRLALPESRQARPGANDNSAFILVEIDKQAPYLRLDGRPLTVEKLEAELKARASGNPRQSLAIRADARAPFEQVVKVMDAARNARLTNFSAFVRGEGGAPAP